MQRRTAQKRLTTVGKPTSKSIWVERACDGERQNPVETAQMENESRPRLRKLFWNLQRGVRPNAQARRVPSPNHVSVAKGSPAPLAKGA